MTKILSSDTLTEPGLGFKVGDVIEYNRHNSGYIVLAETADAIKLESGTKGIVMNVQPGWNFLLRILWMNGRQCNLNRHETLSYVTWVDR